MQQRCASLSVLFAAIFGLQAVPKKTVWLRANRNANCYFIDMWCAKFGDGTRRYSP